MQAEQQSEREAVSARITAYLSGGGLFNPELANHEAVRDLLIDCRAALSHPSTQGCPVPHDVALDIAGPFNACMFRQHCRAMLAVSPPPPEQGSKHADKA